MFSLDASIVLKDKALGEQAQKHKGYMIACTGNKEDKPSQ